LAYIIVIAVSVQTLENIEARSSIIESRLNAICDTDTLGLREFHIELRLILFCWIVHKLEGCVNPNIISGGDAAVLFSLWVIIRARPNNKFINPTCTGFLCHEAQTLILKDSILVIAVNGWALILSIDR
jgi:hypothetical protein